MINERQKYKTLPLAMWQPEEDISDPPAGYGFTPDSMPEKDIYFFHSDHLGSTSYLTDTAGNVTQFVWYSPYGESIIDEHTTGYENPFKFSGKELDDVTGLYDHWMRQRNPVTTLWLTPDPLRDFYPDFSPYHYCYGNPVKFIDRFGMEGESTERSVMLPEIVVEAKRRENRVVLPTQSHFETITSYSMRPNINDLNRQQHTQKSGSMDWKPFAGAVATAGQELYYSKKYGTWMGKNFKIYKQSWGGNGSTGGKNKFAKYRSKWFERAGRTIGFASAANILYQRLNNEINTGQLLLEEASNAYSTFGGVYGAAWGIGWEIGREVTYTDSYQEMKFNFFYDLWEKQYGTPCEDNEVMWNYFFENYQP